MAFTKEQIHKVCIDNGADLAGFANVDAFVAAPPAAHPANVMKGCRPVIVMACRIPPEVLDYDTARYTFVRNGMVARVNDISKNVAAELKKSGHRSKSIVSTGGKYHDGIFRGPISLKHAGELAGLGVITKNYLLTNERFGNMMWLGAVLTDMEAEPDVPVRFDVCNECGSCFESCPSGALRNDGTLDQNVCRRTCYKTVKGKLDLKCWQCRKVCKYGRGAERG